MRINRRELLWQWGGGLGGVALAQMLGQEGLLADTPQPRPEFNGGLHHKARAKRVVQLFMSGAASQVDTFDYKPALIQRNGQAFDPGEKVELFQSNPGPVMASPWEWAQHGQCGKWVSSLVPHIAERVDDIAFLHSMIAKSNVHGPATFMQNTGFVLPGYPSMGAWLSYGLGSMNERPADVRCAARPAGLSSQRPGQLAGRVSARGASGDDDPRGPRESDSRPVPSRCGRLRHSRQ